MTKNYDKIEAIQSLFSINIDKITLAKNITNTTAMEDIIISLKNIDREYSLKNIKDIHIVNFLLKNITLIENLNIDFKKEILSHCPSEERKSLINGKFTANSSLDKAILFFFKAFNDSKDLVCQIKKKLNIDFDFKIKNPENTYLIVNEINKLINKLDVVPEVLKLNIPSILSDKISITNQLHILHNFKKLFNNGIYEFNPEDYFQASDPLEQSVITKNIIFLTTELKKNYPDKNFSQLNIKDLTNQFTLIKTTDKEKKNDQQIR